VKTLVLNDVNKMGQQVQSHFNLFEKTLKFLRAKLKILELHQNNLKTPKLKKYPQHYFPPCETFKMTRSKLKILEFQNTKTKTFKVHKKKGTYFIFLLVKLHTKN
jgi:hypothetical protein